MYYWTLTCGPTTKECEHCYYQAFGGRICRVPLKSCLFAFLTAYRICTSVNTNHFLNVLVFRSKTIPLIHPKLVLRVQQVCEASDVYVYYHRANIRQLRSTICQLRGTCASCGFVPQLPRLNVLPLCLHGTTIKPIMFRPGPCEVPYFPTYNLYL